MNRMRAHRDDAGFTLTELLAYMLVLGIVLGIGGSILIQIVKNQAEIKAMAEANNEAQVVFKEIEDDLRNAAWATVAYNGNLMVIQKRSATPGAPDTVVCVAYYLDQGAQVLRRSAQLSNVHTHAALAAGSEALVRTQAAAWPVSRDGYGPIDGQTAFGPLAGTYMAPELVAVNLRANVSDANKPIDFSKSVSLRKQSGIGSGCA